MEFEEKSPIKRLNSLRISNNWEAGLYDENSLIRLYSYAHLGLWEEALRDEDENVRREAEKKRKIKKN